MIDYMSRLTLDGKKAVVTGGAGLIGKAVVAALAEAGSHVIIADLDKKRGKDLADRLSGKGLKVKYHHLDMADIKNLRKNIRNLTKDLGGLDIWINSAYPRTKDWGAKAVDVSCRSWQKNIDMHLNSYSLSAKYAAEHMKKKGGAVLNLGSIYGVYGPDFAIYKNTAIQNPIAYSVIKGGIVNLGRYLASYFGRYNIRVNTICPGGVFDSQDRAFVKNYSAKVPLKRMATAEEVASSALFLVSDAASYITGATIIVDGGWSSI